jgi:hypothetical protein
VGVRSEISSADLIEVETIDPHRPSVGDPFLARLGEIEDLPSWNDPSRLRGRTAIPPPSSEASLTAPAPEMIRMFLQESRLRTAEGFN